MEITGGNIFLPDYQFHTGNLTIQEDYIADISITNEQTASPKNSDRVLDAGGCYVIPGLIDIHFHGCAGADLCDGSQEALQKIASYEASQGITGICPASMTLPEPSLMQLLSTAASTSSVTDCADLLGIHLEGPFLSAAKCGAQNTDYLHKPDISMFRRLQQAAQGLIRIVSIAPEEDSSLSFTSEISKECVVSLGHTAADYTLCKKAFAAGASHVTHLFNAMLPFTHREPGLIGAAFDTPTSTVELICDGIHVDATAVRMAFQLFTDARIIFISDSMQATGMPDGQYTLGGQVVTVCGRYATLKDGTLAGSVSSLMDCVRQAVAFGIPLESALRCATANPAHRIGVSHTHGYLKPGYPANIVILNPDLSIRHVLLRGRQIL